MEAVRRATTTDAPALAELARHARADALEKRGGRLLVDSELAPLDRNGTIELPDGERADGDIGRVVLVGTIDEVPVGYTVMCIEELRTGDRLGVVHEIFVEPEARGVGVGEIMMDEVVAICEHHGCVGVDSRALPGDRATKNFFETFGLVARAIVVHRKLGS